MIRENQRLLNWCSCVLDGALVLLSYFLSRFLWLDVFKENMRNETVISPRTSLAALIYVVVLLLLYSAFKLYDLERSQTVGRVAFRLLEANTLGMLGITAVLYLFRLQEFSRGVLGLFFLFSTLLVFSKHAVMHAVLGYCRSKGYNRKHVLVVGGGRLARQYAESVQKAPTLGFHIEGYVSDQACAELGERRGTYADLSGLLIGTDYDEVVVALEAEEADRIGPILAACEKEGTKVSIIPFYSEYIPTRPTIDVIGESKLINIRSTPLDNVLLAALKRLMDVLGAMLLIVLSSPLMLAAVVGIKLTSPGPVIFRQERVGLNKKVFTMYKFRSMRVNNTSSTAWSKNEDTRKTKFGSLLRKTSIDELPQFFNVLKGDMSLVGPRPEIPHFVEQFKESVPLYMVKHQVRPGVTGWAQINGYRGDTSIEGRVRCDIWYIENWSLWLDLRILFRTAFGGMLNPEKLAR